jgi:hypothetical protein
MGKILGIGSALCILALVLVGLALISTTGDLFTFRGDLEQEYERRALLQQQLEESGQLRGERIAALQAFHAGCIDLDQVIHEFRSLNQQNPTLLERLQELYPGHTEEEYLGCQMLATVRGSALEDSDREALESELVRELTRRFQSDLFQTFARRGNNHSPPAADDAAPDREHGDR